MASALEIVLRVIARSKDSNYPFANAIHELRKAVRLMQVDAGFLKAAEAYGEMMSRDMRNASDKAEIQERIASLHGALLAAYRVHLAAQGETSGEA